MSVSTKTPHRHFSIPPIRFTDQQSGTRNPHDTEYQSSKRPRLSETMKNPTMPQFNNRPTMAANTYKSSLCLRFKNGDGCRYGSNCHFAHHLGELRKPASHGQKMVAKDTVSFGYSRLYKWSGNGDERPYGYRCRFHHEGDTGEMQRKTYAINIQASGDNVENTVAGSSSTTKEEGYQRSIFWKTRLCIKWQMYQDCPYGSRCCFAHGQAELLPGPNSKVRKLSSSSIAGSDENEACNGGGSATAQKQLVEGHRCLIKFKEVKKIIGIYADWIDDIYAFSA